MNPLFSSLLSRILIDRRGGHRRSVLTAYAEKKRAALLAREEQERYRNQKLADLLNHARIHVPFWRQHIPDVATAAHARELLSTLPVMERSAIQANRVLFVDERVSGQSKAANPNSKIAEDATGGSSGTPMKFLVDRETQIARESSLYWSDSLAGWRYGQRIAMLWGSDKDNRNAAAEAKLAFRWWIDNRRWFNAFNMGEEQMAAFHRAMTRFRPHIIVAYAGSLEVYARYLRDNIQHSRLNDQRSQDGSTAIISKSQIRNPKSEIPSYPLTALISSAEVLTPQARETVEGVFGKPVFNRYGSREFGALAAEDGKGEGLLINPSDCILEIDSVDPVNVPGPLLVTYLANHAMPFLRYSTGDLARMSADGSRILALAGRESDTIRTAGGKLIHGEFFTHLLYRVTSVREFQFVQEELNRYRLLLVAERPVPEEVAASLKADIHDEVGADASVEIEYAESIPVLSSGKRKFTISKVKT